MPAYDSFFCHNSNDKPAVRRIARQLLQRGIRVWFDEWAIPPGVIWQDVLEQQIEEINSAVVFVGKSGIGPWQNYEIKALLDRFQDRGCRIIPAILPDAVNTPELPLFLKNHHYLDFRKSEPDPLTNLIWGITDEEPQRKFPLPMKGEIAAGGIVEASTGFQKIIEVDALLIEPTCYGLKVTGDSMIEAGIQANDTVIIEPIEDADQVNQGAIVAVWVEGDGNLLKQIIKGNPVILRSFNSAYPDIPIELDNHEIKIQGVLVKIIRDGKAFNLSDL